MISEAIGGPSNNKDAPSAAFEGSGGMLFQFEADPPTVTMQVLHLCKKGNNARLLCFSRPSACEQPASQPTSPVRRNGVPQDIEWLSPPCWRAQLYAHMRVRRSQTRGR